MLYLPGQLTDGIEPSDDPLITVRDGRIFECREYMDTEHVTDVICGGKRPAQS